MTQKKSPAGTFLLTPEQHRDYARRARELAKTKPGQGLEKQAKDHEAAAQMIERATARAQGSSS